MKKKEIKAALEALRPIKPQRIADEAIREAILGNTLSLLSAQRQYEQDAKDLERAHLGGWEKERADLAQLRASLQREPDREKRAELQAKIDSYGELFDVIREFNKRVLALGEETAPVTPMDRDAFIKQMQTQEYDLGMIIDLSPLFDTKQPTP